MAALVPCLNTSIHRFRHCHVRLLQDDLCQGEDWKKIGDSCFKLFGDTTTSWTGAQKACESHGAWLAELAIDLDADISYDLIVIYADLLDTHGAWIGLRSSAVKDGHLVWHTSGEQVTRDVSWMPTFSVCQKY